MRPKDKQSNGVGAGADAPAPPSLAGGEDVCYLPLLDDDGTLSEPRHLVREYEPGAEHVIDLSPGSSAVNSSVSVLAPRDGESAAGYSGRLQHPAERTAAWKIALAAPIAIRLDGLDEHRAAVVAYVRELLS